MKPRKVILVVDSNPNSLSTLAFTLDVRGYRVLTAPTATDAIELLGIPEISLVLSQGWLIGGITGFDLAFKMKQSGSRTPIVLLVGPWNCDEQTDADALLSWSMSTAELLERIKVMSRRKPGPKPVLRRGPATKRGPQADTQGRVTRMMRLAAKAASA